MSNAKHKLFNISEDEITRILFAEDSECEDLILDEEDQEFLCEDVETVRGEVVIEDPEHNVTKVGQNKPLIQTDAPNENVSSSLKKQSAKCKEKILKWEKTDSSKNVVTSSFPFSKVKILYSDNPEPIDIFERTCGFEDLFKCVCDQSNLYMQQKGEAFETYAEELKAFLGMNYVMGYHVLPSLRDYWSTQPDLQVPFISNIMPRARFEKIRSALHFSDNSKILPRDDPEYDRAHKIRPLINHFNKYFQDAREPSQCEAVDEHMIKFKGHSGMKQYIKNKPVKWGFKLWCRCDSETGYLYHFDLYTGKKKHSEKGLGESVVLQLCEPLQGLGVRVFFDNFFNSPSLQIDLLEKNILACGTVRGDRKGMPKNFMKDKDMKRGDIDFFSVQGISCVKWMDTRAVLLLTNYISPSEHVVVERRKSGSAEKMKVNCPAMVKYYNKYMGGVDLMDQLKSTYEVDRKSKIKYYLRIFFDLLDIAVNNAYIVYSQLQTESG